MVVSSAHNGPTDLLAGGRVKPAAPLSLAELIGTDRLAEVRGLVRPLEGPGTGEIRSLAKCLSRRIAAVRPVLATPVQAILTQTRTGKCPRARVGLRRRPSHNIDVICPSATANLSRITGTGRYM